MQKMIVFLLDLLAFLQIAISPSLIGLFLGGCIYYCVPTKIGIILAITFVLLGIIIGIVWAIKTTRKFGTSSMLFRLTHQPEFDKDEFE